MRISHFGRSRARIDEHVERYRAVHNHFLAEDAINLRLFAAMRGGLGTSALVATGAVLNFEAPSSPGEWVVAGIGTLIAAREVRQATVVYPEMYTAVGIVMGEQMEAATPHLHTPASTA